MIAKTLKTAVLKTVKVTGVKLATPADRIGLGLRASANSMDNLSLGQFPMPHYPESEQVRVQPLSSMQMREQMQADHAATRDGSAGCLRVPGFSAVTRPVARPVPSTGWQRTTRTTSIGRTTAFCSFVHLRFTTDRARQERPGSDCQSPGRESDKPIGRLEASSATTAKK